MTPGMVDIDPLGTAIDQAKAALHGAQSLTEKERWLRDILDNLVTAVEGTPGTIGVLSMELSRYADFNASLSCIRKPGNTAVIWSLGQESGKSVIDKTNYLCESIQGDWLWILGDDHKFGEDALFNLLAQDVDVACPVNIGRAMPFSPLVFDEDGKAQDWTVYGASQGLVELQGACGNAGMLIKRRVLEAIPQPWFEYAPNGSPYHGSDLAFCWKARQAGFKVHIDTDTVFGHTTIATFIPCRLEDGTFAAMMTVQGQQVALFRFKQGQGTTLFEQRGIRD